MVSWNVVWASLLTVVFLVLCFFHLLILVLESTTLMGTMSTVFSMQDIVSRYFRTGTFLSFLMFGLNIIIVYGDVFLLGHRIYRLCGHQTFTKTYKLGDTVIYRIKMLNDHSMRICMLLFEKQYHQHSCPSGLRGPTQVRMYSYSWVQIIRTRGFKSHRMQDFALIMSSPTPNAYFSLKALSSPIVRGNDILNFMEDSSNNEVFTIDSTIVLDIYDKRRDNATDTKGHEMKPHNKREAVRASCLFELQDKIERCKSTQVSLNDTWSWVSRQPNLF